MNNNTISLRTSGSIIQIARPFHTLSIKGERALAQGLREGGEKTRTQVRKSLKAQMGVRRYSTIVRHTSGTLAAHGELAYIIKGIGKGLPIAEFPVKRTKSGIHAAPWQAGRTFQRSFVQTSTGAFKARTSSKRFPLRALYGPSPAKEIVQGRALESFNTSVRHDVRKAVEKRLAWLIRS